MIKKVVILLVFLGFSSNPTWAQFDHKRADSLRQALYRGKHDSVRCKIGTLIYDLYEESNRDSAIYYANHTISIARKNDQILLEGYSLTRKAYQLIHIGHYSEALEALLKAFSILQSEANEMSAFWTITGENVHQFRLDNLAQTHVVYALLMDFTENQAEEIPHFKTSLQIAREIKSLRRQTIALMNLGWAYNVFRNELDSAIYYHQEAEKSALESGYTHYLALVYVSMGDIYLKKNNPKEAKHYYVKSKHAASGRPSGLVFAYHGLTNYHLTHHTPDSSLYYAWKTTNTLKSVGGQVDISLNLGTCYENLYKSYKLNHRPDSAFKYLELALVTKDSLYQSRIRHLADFQKLNFREQLRMRALQEQMIRQQARIRTYVLLAGTLIIGLIALLLYRNNRQKQKANIQLKESYTNLRNAQSQLIQSEKMASLGELTAGIAHEIQNPLNFVNNFSEVNAELIEELKAESLKPKAERNEQVLLEILETLKKNELKVVQHGKRADAIVKGMLQHSRKSSGQKELTDINALCDEYLRLAYHGLRAKDKSFNAKFETHLDPTLPKISVVPQDIGRVVLNLINNAFYAVGERQKAESKKPGSTYEPSVTVSTRVGSPLGVGGAGRIEIAVKDNGPGIPDHIKDKIFQPFFTTKPTGQGTGLGLSLSYDIVKAHDGTLQVETSENKGTTFSIHLPS